jgi:branched-chain amino acid transport system substrate-binding protein
MKKKHLVLITLVLAFAMLFAACTGSSPSSTPAQDQTPASSDGPEAQAPAERQTLKIGIISCFSGASARSAEIQLVGLQAALKNIKDSGYSKYYDFELIQGDDQYDAAEAVKAANKAIYQDGIKVAFGHLNSTVTFAALPTYEEAKVPVFTPSYSMNITNSGFEYVYRATPNDEVFARSLVNFLVEEKGIKSIGLFHCNNDQGESGKEMMTAALADKGMEFKRIETYSLQDSDFTGPLLNFRNDKVEAVIIYGGDIVGRSNIVTQIRQLFDYDVVLAGDNAFSNSSFLEVTPVDIREGLYYVGAWASSLDTAQSKLFIDTFKELDPMGQIPGDVSARFYDAMYILTTALNNMGPYDVNAEDFTEKLNEQIKLAEYEGLQGTLKSNERGDLIHKSYVIQFQGEEQNVVY